MRGPTRGAIRLEEVRKTCGKWDKEEGCKEDYPEECVAFADCERDAIGQIEGGGSYGG